MRMLIKLLAVLLLGLLPVSADVVVVVGRPAPTAGATYLINQRFEGAGYDNGESWTEALNNPDEDYATNPLQGSQSCLLDATTVTVRLDSPSFADTADAWIYMKMRVDTRPSIGSTFLVLRNSLAAVLGAVEVNATGILRVDNNVSVGNTVDASPEDTDFHVWVHYVKGVLNDSVMSVAFSTDGVRPTSGNAFVELTNGNAITDLDSIRITAINTKVIVVDQVLIDDAQIGDSPP
jgi:hypothetical protein